MSVGERKRERRKRSKEARYWTGKEEGNGGEEGRLGARRLRWYIRASGVITVAFFALSCDTLALSCVT